MKKIKKFEEFSYGDNWISTTTSLTPIEVLKKNIEKMTKDTFVDDTVKMKIFLENNPDLKQPPREWNEITRLWEEISRIWEEKSIEFFDEKEYDEILREINKKYDEVRETKK